MFQLVQPNPVCCIVARHVAQYDGVALMKTFDYLNCVDRGAAHLNRCADCPFSIRIQTKEGDGAVLVAESRTADIKNILHPFQIDGAVNTQVCTQSVW